MCIRDSAYIVYRRSEKEMPARLEEIHHAKEEGVEFMLLCAPVRIIGDENGRVKGLECIRMELGEPDESGRRRPVKIEGSEFILEADTVISAIGNTPNPLIRSTTKGLEANKKGCIMVNQETLETSIKNIYAGGDAVSGAATVILAMGAGKLRTVFTIVLPSAMPGILSGVILATGRIVGETAALIYTASSVAKIPTSVFSSTRTLAVHMYLLSNEGLYIGQTYGTAVVLLVLVLVINCLSGFVAGRLAKK